MAEPLKVNYTYTGDVAEAKKLLSELPAVVACDFEAASKIKPDRRAYLTDRAARAGISVAYRNKLLQSLNATGLSHPSLVDITHFSCAWSPTDSLVIVTDTPEMRAMLYEWLVTTTVKQIWHNAGFDFKHIRYATGKIPINFEDTQLLAKVLLNDANNFKAQTGLKGLMGYAYTSFWKDLADGFAPKDPYDEDFIHYAAIDACATFKLWYDMQLHPRMEGTTPELVFEC